MTEYSIPTPDQEAFQAIADQGSFEESLQALEQIVGLLERGRLSIDEAVNWYEIGLALTSRCTELLEQAELRVTTLEQTYGRSGRINES
jgi:exodeoxyribonuclease VII small subunit